jgi:MFS family permease
VATLATALFIFGFGQELWARYLPEYLRFLGASALTVGLFGTLQDLLDAAYAYPGGALADRVGSRRALLLSAALTAAGIAVYLLWSSVAAVFFGLLLVAAWKSLGLPATFTLIAEEISGPRRIVGFTAQSIVKRLPIALAPPLGGLLIARLGMGRGMRAGFAVSLVLSAVMLLGLRLAFRRTHPPPLPPAAEGKGWGQGLATARTRLHPDLKRLLVADCLIRLCEGLPGVFLVIWALEVVHVSAPQFGLLQSVMMTTAILSYVPAATLAERAEKKPFVLLTFFFFTLFPLAVVLSRSFVALAVAYVIGGLREIGEPARKALIVDLADPSARGKAVGLYYAARGFSVAGAAAIGGALWTIRPELTFFAAAGLGAAGTAWAAAFLPASPRIQA